MLGRAVECINRGRFHRPYTLTKDLIQSRRMLHSAFWRHGAGDLDLLPAWSFQILSTLLEPERTTGLDSHGLRLVQQPGTRPLLDLLSSEQTKYLIERLPIFNWRQWQRNVRRWNKAIPLRAFASSADKNPDDGSSNQPQDPSSSRATGDAPTNISPSEALKELQEYLVAHKSGRNQDSWSVAWQLYQSLDPSQKTTSLIHALVELLASSPRISDAQKAVELFEFISIRDRQPEIYPTILSILLKLKYMTKTVRIIEDALESHINPSVAGADMLLAHFIANRQWQLLFRVWRRCIESFENTHFLASWKSAFFEKIFLTPNYHDRVVSLLYAIEAFPNSLSPEADKLFVASLVKSLFDHGSEFGPKDTRRIVSIMNQLQILEPYLFETAILRLLLGDKDTNAGIRMRTKYAFKIYEECQGINPPNKPVMRAILNAANGVGFEAAIHRIYDDWHTVFGTPELEDTGHFMKCFANFGSTEKVESLFHDYIASGGTQSLKLHYPLLQVRARMGQPDAVRKHMESMKSEADLIPDTTCWNILMNAYQRDRNLAGALSCMSELLGAGITPDYHTIGALMGLAANRGDVELAEQLYYKTANSLNISRSKVWDDCMVLALLNNNQLQRAEGFAVLATKEESEPWRRMRMWNQILAHYCLQRPPANIRNVLRIAKVMRQLRVPFNSWSYSAMMRAYAVGRRTDFARRILHKVMLRNRISVRAFHYAILIDGYTNEMAFEKGLRMYAEMLQGGTKPDISSNRALLKIQAVSARNKVYSDHASRAGVRADVPEETLEELLAAPNTMAYANNRPRIGSVRFNPVEAYPAAYFSILLNLYGKLRAFDMVKSLLSRYERNRETLQPDLNQSIPFHFLSVIMNINYRESEHSEVERCWKLAKETALKVSMTGDQIRRNAEKPDRFAPIRRTALAMPLNIYLRSLDAQNAQDKMKEEVDGLLASGFELDNKNWNIYVQLLITREYFLEAFTLCESRLMPSFKGWGSKYERIKHMQAAGRKSPGLEYRGTRQGYYFLRPGQLEVEYATIVRFSRALTILRQRAPFERAMKDILTEVESKAPMTVQAVTDMPRVQNDVTRHLLRKARVENWTKVLSMGKPKRMPRSRKKADS